MATAVYEFAAIWDSYTEINTSQTDQYLVILSSKTCVFEEI